MEDAGLSRTAPLIYVDPIFEWPEDCYRSEEARRVGEKHGHRWSHFFADPDDASMAELHRVAGLIGMRRAWFQPDKDGGHYDLVPPRRKRAVRLGAKEVTEEEAVAIWDRSQEARKAQQLVQLVAPQSPQLVTPSILRYEATCEAGHRVIRPMQPTVALACGCGMMVAPTAFVVCF